MATDPATSYAWIRLRISPGTWVWTLVAHITLQNAQAVPATSTAAATAGTGSPAPTAAG